MIDYAFLQSYWWVLVSILGALLVFLLFVQGGQTMIWHARNDSERSMMVNSLGRKWEYTFTTLVTFGGAFFASFPLFYSTSFGGAYWLWMLILFSFILQAVSLEEFLAHGEIAFVAPRKAGAAHANGDFGFYHINQWWCVFTANIISKHETRRDRTTGFDPFTDWTVNLIS